MLINFVFFLLIFIFLLRRKIDSYLIAAFGLLIYYLPVYSGLLVRLDASGRYVGAGVEPDLTLQLSIIFILLILLISSLVSLSRSAVRRPVRRFSVNEKYVALSTVLFSLFIVLISAPSALRVIGKVARSHEIGIFSTLSIYFMPLGLVFSILAISNARNKFNQIFYIVAAITIVVFSIFIMQTRSLVFFAVLALILKEKYNEKLSLKFISFRAWLVIIAVFLIFIGKHISNILFSGIEYDSISGVIYDSFESILISSALNDVFSYGIRADTLNDFFLNIIPGYSAAGAIDYHDVMISKIYVSANYGMGRNPIGELWINFGNIGILYYSIFLSFKCWLFDEAYNRTDGVLRVFICVLIFYGLFYVNRNSFVTDFIYFINFTTFMGAVVLFSSIIFRVYLLRWSK